MTPGLPPRQLPLELGHRPAFGKEDFLVNRCNADAVAWIDRWPDWPAGALAIYGPAGSGKTHLASVWQASSGAHPVPVDAISAEAVPGIVARGTELVVEPGACDERGLLHLMNTLRELGGYILLTGHEPPARWPVKLPDLASRLAAVPAVRLRAPDDELLGAVLVKLFADRQVQVGKGLVSYLVKRMERSFEAARKVAAALDEAALAEGRALTVPLARSALGWD